jgi:hypothetical protein
MEAPWRVEGIVDEPFGYAKSALPMTLTFRAALKTGTDWTMRARASRSVWGAERSRWRR